jgi:hypothetical protein
VARIAVIGVPTAVTAGIVNFSSPHSPPTRLLSSEQTVLPFTGLKDPTAVAVDAKGAVYVADAMTARVLKLTAG